MEGDNQKRYSDKPLDGPMKLINEFFERHPKQSIFDSMDDFFRKTFIMPAFRIYTEEKGDTFIIYAELPGVEKEAIRLKLSGDDLIISVKQKENAPDRSRTVRLPSYVIKRNMKASFQNGLLTVRLPKQKEEWIEIE